MIEAPDGGAGGGWLVHTVAFYLGQWRQCRSQEQDLVGIIDRSPCRAHSLQHAFSFYHTIPPGLLVIRVLLVVAFVFVDVG